MNLMARALRILVDIIFPPRDTELLVKKCHFSLLEKIYRPQTIRIEEIPIVALLPYRSSLVQAFILEAKFHNNKKAQEFLGRILEIYLRKALASSESLAIVPLPLGKKRVKERGYSQVERIARYSGFPLEIELLVRARETTPQTTLGREARIHNMEGAFSVNTAIRSAATYILLDDVVTTGATLLAAHEALTKAGVKEVFPLALAH
jgi:ComF family protein